MDELDREHVGIQTRHRIVKVTEDELTRTIATITQQHAEDRSRARAARLRAEEETGELGRQGLEDTALTLPLATPEGIVRAPHIPPCQDRPRHYCLFSATRFRRNGIPLSGSAPAIGCRLFYRRLRPFSPKTASRPAPSIPRNGPDRSRRPSVLKPER